MTFLEILRKKEKGTIEKEEKGEKERTNHSQKSTSFGENEEDLAFQRAHILKVISEGEVRSSLSVYNK